MSGPPTAWATLIRCWPPLQPSRTVQPGMLTHMSRGSDTIAADFETGSMLSTIIVSERVPAIGSSSRLSMPRTRILTRSVPFQSGRTVLTAEASEVEISGGLTGMLIGPGLMATGTVTDIGPAPTVTTRVGWPAARSLARAASTRQLATNMTPKAAPPSTNAQNAATAKVGGPERPGLGTLMGS